VASPVLKERCKLSQVDPLPQPKLNFVQSLKIRLMATILMISLNQKSTDQTESLDGGATTLGGGTPDTGSGPFRLNFIAAYRPRPIRFGCGWGCALPGSAKRRDLLCVLHTNKAIENSLLV